MSRLFALPSSLYRIRKRPRGSVVKEVQNRPQKRTRILEVRLFGVPTFLRADGEAVALPGRKDRALLAYLAAHPEVELSRDRLVELIWPDAAEGAGRASLRQALSTIRKALGKDAGALIHSDRETVMLGGTGLITDLGRLETMAADPDTADRAPIGFQGPFLEGLASISPEFDSWRATEQARLSALAGQLLTSLAQRAEAERRLADAAALLTRALAVDPIAEALHRRLMRVYVAQGRADAALRQFQSLEALLEAELEVRPDRETVELVRDIRARRQGRKTSPPALQSPTAAPAGAEMQTAKPAQALEAPSAASPSHSNAPPATHYAKSGDLNIAYQVIGEGPLDIVYVPGWVSNLDYAWTSRRMAHVFERLSSFARLIVFDKRGTGLSDRNVGYPTLEERMDDLNTVMDAVGSERAALIGTSEGGNMCMLFAATYPERTAALVLYGSFAKGLWAEDYPWAKTREQVEEELDAIARDWGGPVDLSNAAPSLNDDEAERAWAAMYLRNAATPQDAISLWRWNIEIDVRDILPAIHVPTLVLHRSGDRWVKVAEARYLADRIEGARFVELPGDDHVIWAGDSDRALEEIEDFLTGVQRAPPSERVLATILVADIGGTTSRAKKLDDEREKAMRQNHFDHLRAEVRRYGGAMIKTAENGLLAKFDGPSKAIQCASAIRESIDAMGSNVRAAVHTGECELRGTAVSGDALDVATRLIGFAGRGEILVSRIVKDLVVGSGIPLEERDEVTLRDSPGAWQLYSVTSSPGEG